MDEEPRELLTPLNPLHLWPGGPPLVQPHDRLAEAGSYTVLRPGNEGQS